MKQKAKELLPGTVIKDEVGTLGTLKMLKKNNVGILCWAIDWHGLPMKYATWVSAKTVQTFELA